MKFEVKTRGKNTESHWEAIHKSTSKEWNDMSDQDRDARIERDSNYMRVFKSLEFEDVESVVEIGAALGEHLAYFARKLPDMRFKAIDFTQASFDHAQKYNLPNYSFEKRDFLNNFIDENHDVIILIETLEHIEQGTNYKIVDELLKKCKILYITVPNTQDDCNGEHISHYTLSSFDRYDVETKEPIDNVHLFFKLKGNQSDS
jgi:trans-aconitate methyltransferase